MAGRNAKASIALTSVLGGLLTAGLVFWLSWGQTGASRADVRAVADECKDRVEQREEQCKEGMTEMDERVDSLEAERHQDDIYQAQLNGTIKSIDNRLTRIETEQAQLPAKVVEAILAAENP